MVLCGKLSQRMVAAVSAMALFAIMAAPAHGQGVTATVSGTVKDAQSGVIPGATVTLISESRGTVSTPVVTNTTGDFVFPNVTGDIYTIRVALDGFKTAERKGITVSAGDHLSIGTMTIEVGALAETVVVSGEAPMIQAASGERSFTVSTESVNNLPLANRSYDALLALAPGVNSTPGALTPATRLGGGGDGNFMLDGATAMDPGVNRPASRISVEAIAEVKVVTSGYQAEYGRSSGLQINAVTKSGTNQFRGSLYDVERSSKWNKNSQTNILNGDPKPFQKERDFGYAIGGPIGKPGGNNKLFFYFNEEFNPRDVGNTVVRYRLPTALERQGDFSKSTDNNGNPFPYIKDPLKAGTCSAASRVACFADGGVLGRIPKDRLYQAGLNVLNWWPQPNIANPPAGQPYNYEITAPAIHLLGYQPIIRIDYQPFTNLRGSFKYLEYQQPNKPIVGTIPGFSDSYEDDYGIFVPAGTLNWAINSSTFLEGSWGSNYHHQEGCSITGGSPNFCQSGIPTNAIANRNTAGFGAIPYLFQDATKLEPGTFSYDVISRNNPPIWDGSRVVAAPSFTWGTRVASNNSNLAPPDNQGPFGNFILDTALTNVNVSVTKVTGHHTIKSGYYHFKSIQRRGQGAFLGSINFGNDSNNPIDSGFGFANAALGVFSTYGQQSRWGEGKYTAVNEEAYVQDNWKLRSNLTVDLGVRFVHQVPQYDGYLKSSNFLPEKWAASAAPTLFVAACAGASPCTGTTRQAMNPITGQLLGPGSAIAIGTLVPGTGSTVNGVFADGQGIVKTNYKYPGLGMTPRVGTAWDLSGNQTFVVRGSAGLFFDRPPANTVYNTVNNPPFSRNITVRYGQLQDLASTGLATEAAPTLTVFQYDMKLPSSTQWSGGVQMALPYSSALDVAYTGQHSFNTLLGANLNSIDLGTAFMPETQDSTQTSAVPGAASKAALSPELVRPFRGFGTITQQQDRGWRTYHSLQVSFNRRFSRGVQFGFNDTIGLSDHQAVARRLQHNANGTITDRADQAAAQDLLGNNHPQRHIMRGSFIWQLPKVASDSPAMHAIGLVANDWSLSGIWSGATPSTYVVTSTYATNGNAVNITGSPDFTPRVRLVGDSGSGCSADRLRQFNTAAFQGPLVGSVGLDSGNGDLKGCFISQTDLAIARTISLGGGRSIQLRMDIFNAFNQAGITDRVTAVQFASPTDMTPQNLPFDAAGNVVDARSRPRGAGFGVASTYQSPRTMQGQIRFAF